MIIKKMEYIIGKFCPMTVLLNVGAIGVSFTDIEIGLKLVSYAVAIIWTTLRIAKEVKNWNEKNG